MKKLFFLKILDSYQESMEIQNWKYHQRTYPLQLSNDEFQQLILLRGRVHDRRSVNDRISKNKIHWNIGRIFCNFFLSKYSAPLKSTELGKILKNGQDLAKRRKTLSTIYQMSKLGISTKYDIILKKIVSTRMKRS